MDNFQTTPTGENNNETKTNKTSDHLYLEKLEFNPVLRKSWLNFFVTNFRVVLLLILLLTGWGIYAFVNLPRESNPEVKIPIAVVITSYPGASPVDIEELVTKKIETGLSGLKNVKKISSNSLNSISTVQVEFEASADLEDSLRKLRDQVNTIKKDLPADASDPQVREISFDDTPIWSIALSGPYDGLTLYTWADDIKDELEKIPGVREVKISGGDQTEIEVAYNPDQLAQFGISADQADQAIKASNLAMPAGSFDGTRFTYPIRSDARLYKADDVARVAIGHSEDGGLIMVKDVATVAEKPIKRTVMSRLSNGGQQPQPAITIDIVKKTGSSIIDTVNLAQKSVDSYIAKLPNGVKYTVITDYAKTINDDFKQLSHDFLLTILLVGTVLFLIVGLKEALVAGLAIPLVFFATFGTMLMTGISLNFLSTFSLILALGLLVDDAIVVVSATKQYMKTGKFTPEEAVLLVLNDFKVVLTTTTLTTVWAFLPLLMASGMIGQFIKSIPITVSVTLLASLLIALMINHPLAAVLERIRLTRTLFRTYLVGILAIAALTIYYGSLPFKIIVSVLALGAIIWLIKWFKRGGKQVMQANEALVKAEWNDDDLIKEKLRTQAQHKDITLGSKLIHGVIHFDKALPIYEKYLRRIMSTAKSRAKTLWITAGLFVLAITLPIVGIVKTEFFPVSDLEYIYVNIEAPTGLKLAETDKIVQQAEEKLLTYKDITSFSTLVGTQSGARATSINNSSSHLSTIVVKLKPKEERKVKSFVLAEQLRQDLAFINQAKVTIETPSGGPPAGAAFQANIYGDDLQVLDKIARDLEPQLKGIKGVINTDVSLKQSPADYTFSLDSDKMELYNLNAAYVGATLRLAISGVDATTILREGKEIKVVARFDQDKLPTLESIQNLQILNLRKQPVFIKDVAKIELKPSVDTISRIDQKRVVSLTSGVAATTRPAEVLKTFQDKIAKNYKLPAGYSIKYGGENEQNQESVLSILRAMIIAGLLIISTLIIQFNSFKKAMIVLVTIPLALIGVFFGMAVARVNLSFPGLIGILALFGIVVKNAIILIDKMNLNIKSGIPFDEAIIDAGKSRLEAIFITSICTILGIIPITFSDETWRSLGSAIIFGLMLSSFFTLFIVPTLFKTLVKEDERL